MVSLTKLAVAVVEILMDSCELGAIVTWAEIYLCLISVHPLMVVAVVEILMDL